MVSLGAAEPCLPVARQQAGLLQLLVELVHREHRLLGRRLARFSLLGRDAGRERELPLRGGVVGCGDGNLVQLTDPTVSRPHGAIELRDGALRWIDETGKPRTLMNGKAAIMG